LGFERAACLPVTWSRCQRKTVSGRTSNRIRRHERQPVQQRRQKRPIRRSEPHPLPGQLALQHDDLMPQHQDLSVLVAIGHREQAEGREGARHGQVGQSQKHSRSSSRDDRLATPVPAN
jgi:hypothetical protein